MGAGSEGVAAFWWGVLGVGLLLGNAVLRLGARGVEAVAGGLGFLEWVVLVLLTIVSVYGEGVRALGQRWVPFVLKRAAELRTRPERSWRWLAPLYAMGLVGARRRTLLRGWLGVAAIALAVVVVSRMPHPWRGIIDLAVAAALAWGLGALLVLAARASAVEAR